jgi:hypothetical protein
MHLLVFATSAVFVALSSVHWYWALGGRLGKSFAIPSTGDVAHFSPSRTGTVLVAAALLLAAGIVEVAAQGSLAPIWRTISSSAAVLLAAILALRAIGDTRHVGFFKQRNQSRFARLDTFFYSPLCLLLAGSIGLILWSTP